MAVAVGPTIERCTVQSFNHSKVPFLQPCWVLKRRKKALYTEPLIATAQLRKRVCLLTTWPAAWKLGSTLDPKRRLVQCAAKLTPKNKHSSFSFEFPKSTLQMALLKTHTGPSAHTHCQDAASGAPSGEPHPAGQEDALKGWQDAGGRPAAATLDFRFLAQGVSSFLSRSISL